MFQRPFSFDGTIRQLEYALSYIIYMVGYFFAGVIAELLELSESGFGTVIFLQLFIPMIWFMLAQGTKHCHDRGNSGIWQIIPFYGLWMLFADGEIRDNEYGFNPKHDVYDYFPEGRGEHNK